MPVAQLLEHHRQHLLAAAIDPEWAEEFGIYSRDDGLMFPWHLVSGETLYQYRPDMPIGDAKYLFPKGSEIGLGRVRDPGGDWVFIVEGTKQSIAAACWLPSSSAVYGLAGCWNWRAADLHVMKNRKVFIILDADAGTNSQVYKAGEQLRAALILAGAAGVEFPRLPVTGTKGLDDYLAEIRPEDRQDVLIRLAVSAVGKTKPADRRPGGKAKDREGDGAEFFNEDGFRTETFARVLLSKNPGLITAEGRVLLYKNGVYVFDPWGMRLAISNLLGDRYTRYLRDEAEEMAGILLAEAGRYVPKYLSEPYLNVRNGLLDLRTGELVPHTPDVWSVNQIPVVWDPEARCPFYDTWTSRQVFAGRLEDLEEVSSTCLDPTRSPRRALLLFGPPRTGKSTWIRLLEAMVGKENSSGVDMTKLDQRFQAADLYNKMLNASSDIPDAYLTDLSVFKRLTGGDTISVERKFKDPFEFVNRALLAFSMNKPPRVDSSDMPAYETRVKPFKFDKSFRGNEDMTTDEQMHRELPGILVRWVRAWQRFHARGEKYQDTPPRDMGFFPVLRWVDERCLVHDVPEDGTVSEDQGTPPKNLLTAYNTWAAESGEDSINKPADLVQSLKNARPTYVIHGVRIRPSRNRGLNVTLRPEEDTDGDEGGQTRADGGQLNSSNCPPAIPPSTCSFTPKEDQLGQLGSNIEKLSMSENTHFSKSVYPRPVGIENAALTARFDAFPQVRGQIEINNQLPASTASEEYPWTSEDDEATRAMIEEQRGPVTLHIDLETTAYPPEHKLGRIRTVQIAVDDGPVEVFVVEPHPNGTPEQYQDWQTAWQYVKELLNSGVTLVFHNAPGQDVRYLVHEGLLDEPVPWHRIRDTMFEAKIKVPSQERGHYKLERLEEDLLGTTRADEATAKRKKRFAKGKWLTNTEIDTPPERNGWLQVPLDDPDFLDYARTDVTVMRDLSKVLATTVPDEPSWIPPSATIRNDRYSGSISALLDRERRLANLCLGMTRRGVLVDRDLAQDLDRQYALEIASLEGMIRDLGVENPASTQQIAAVLGAEGIRVPVTKKGNPNLDEKALADIDHPLVDLIRRYRRASKDRSSYTQAALKFSAFDDRVHPQINIAEAMTWRMSITDPAMQTIPKYGSNLREMYVADPGYALLSADLASVELRVGAAVSEDENLTQKFLSGESLWDEIRERVFPGAGKESKEHTRTKNVGYGSLFGAGAERLSEYTGSVDLARQIRGEFWRAYPGLRALFQELMELSDEQREAGGKVILNPYGRPLWVPAAAPYKGLNYLIQSTARDLLVDAMFSMEDAGFGDSLWLPVHDELVCMVPEDKVDEAREALVASMTMTLGEIPVTCEVGEPSERWTAK